MLQSQKNYVTACTYVQTQGVKIIGGGPFCPKYLTWSGRSRFRGLQNNVKLILKSILILYLTECFPERRSKIVENAILKDLQFKTFWGGCPRPQTPHMLPSPPHYPLLK
jgi:hypothetical protein